jgi:ubiquitin C-terminal hydrolase
MNNLFEVQPDLKTEQLERFKKYDSVCLGTNSDQDMNMFLAKQSGYVDKFYICPECKKDGEKYKISYLLMVPEVLVILSKKYTVDRKLHINTEFPKTLEFAGLTSDSKLKYEAVSQIEHSGNLDSGHYWSISRRNDGWYKLNDNSVTKAEFKPTENTYIVFYHLV